MVTFEVQKYHKMAIETRKSSVFQFMNQDGLINDSDQASYRCAYTVGKLQENVRSGNIAYDYANKFCLHLPPGSHLKGHYYMEELDWHIFLNTASGEDHIGIFDERKKTYNKIVTNAKLDMPLNFSGPRWRNMAVNVHGNCNRINIVYSDDDMIYRHVHVTDPCCEKRVEIETKLFRPRCFEPGSVRAIRGSGHVRNGAYQVALECHDTENNRTNYSRLSDVVLVADDDYVAGQEVRYGLSIRFEGLPAEYSRGRLVVIESIGGGLKYKVIDNVGIGEGTLTYTYTGSEGYYDPEILKDVLFRKRMNFRGEGVFEHKGRLGLDNVQPKRNWNLQKLVNTFQVRYKRWIVPIDKAHLFPTLPPNEKISLAIRFNGIDGAPETDYFALVNDNVAGTNMVTSPCINCPVPEWMVTDTSKRTDLYFSDTAFDISKKIRSGIETKNPVDISKYLAGAGQPSGGFSAPIEVTTSSGGSSDGELDTRSSSSGGAVLEGGDNQNPDEGYQLSEDSVTCSISKATLACLNTFFVWVTALIESIVVAIGGNFSVDPWEIPVDCLCSPIEEKAAEERAKVQEIKDEVEKASRETSVDSGEKIYKKTKQTCKNDGDVRFEGQMCYECKDGHWHYVENATKGRVHKESYSRKGSPIEVNFGANQDTGLRGGGDDDDKDCFPEYEPTPYSKGCFGYWETDALYPETIGTDDCLPIYGELAGKPVRLFRVPSTSKEELGFALLDGVPNKYDAAAGLKENGYTIVTGIVVENVSIPEEMRPFVCEENPFTVGITPIDEANKTMLGYGSLHSTFEADVNGVPVLFPKHGVNALEYYDAFISGEGDVANRKGRSHDTAAYTFHCPEYHVWGSRSVGDYFLIEQEQSGYGWRFEQYAKGEEPVGITQPRYHNAGTTQAISLAFAQAHAASPEIRCIKGMDHVEHNEFKSKGDRFTKHLSNRYRESAMYIELSGAKLGLFGNTDATAGSINGGDGEDDLSFVGDTLDQEAFVDLSACKTGSAMRWLPNQYGAIEGRAYIPLLDGTGEDLENGSVEGICGHSWTGCFDVRRNGFVSDKVPPLLRPDTPEIDGGTSFVDVLLIVLSVVLPIIRFLLAVTSTFQKATSLNEHCGRPPEDGDTTDPRNVFGLRQIFMRGSTGPGDPVGAPAIDIVSPAVDARISNDIYSPGLLKTSLSFISVSTANLNLRATGDVIIANPITQEDGVAQVYASRLKTLGLSASFPSGSKWTTTWLNRIYLRMTESSALKHTLRTILLAAFVYLPSGYVAYESLEAQIVGFSKAGSGFLGLTGFAGVALLIVYANLLVEAARAWIFAWNNTDLDNKIFTNLLKMDWCFPDNTFVIDGEKEFSMDKGRATYPEDNFYSYNVNYSKRNMEEIGFGIPANYDTQWCPEEYSTRIMLGNKQNPESHISSWRNFEPHNLLEIARTRGKVMRVFTMGDRLIIHTTDTIIVVGTRDLISDVVNEATPLGRQSVFAGYADLFEGVVAGYGGTKDPNAGFVHRTGYYYIDTDSRRPMIFTGSRVNEQPFIGLEDFFDENMRFKILEEWPDFEPRDQKHPQGVHFDMAIDDSRDLLYIHKKDYCLSEGCTTSEGGVKKYKGKVVENFKDLKYYDSCDFTVVWDLKQRRYIGFHYWSPDYMFFNRYTMMAKSGDSIYDWTERERFGEFFGKQYPMVVDVTIPMQQPGGKISQVHDIKVIGEVIQYGSDKTRKKLLKTPVANRIMFYNSHQATDWMEVVEKESRYDITKITDPRPKGTTNWTNTVNGMTISKIRNVVPEGQLARGRYNSELRVFETTFTDQLVDKLLESDYLGVIMEIRRDPSVQVIVREVIVNAEYSANVEQQAP